MQDAKLTTDKLEAFLKEKDAIPRMIALSQPQTVAEMRSIMAVVSELGNRDMPETGNRSQEHVQVDRGLEAMVTVPNGDGPFPVLYYIHGGGWVTGAPSDYRKLMHRFAEQGLMTIAIDYRLAPEHPFPAGYNDCIRGYAWTIANCERWGGNPDRVAVGGDSAGGNLSAAIAIGMAGHDRAPAACALIYGAFDWALNLKENLSEDPALSADLSHDIMTSAYLGESVDNLVLDPRVSPIQAAEKLPPCHIVVGSEDALVPHSNALSKALEEQGIEYEYFIDPQMPHGYFQFEFLDMARPAIKRLCDFLHRQL